MQDTPSAYDFFSDQLASSFPTCEGLAGSFQIDGTEYVEEQYLYETEHGPMIVCYWRDNGETDISWASDEDVAQFHADRIRFSS